LSAPVSVEGVWLVREGDYAIVKVERSGRWVEVIREHVEGPFSHICEPEGILRKEANDAR
jgi:hypothetical protein